MKPELVPTNSLRPAVYNPRKTERERLELVKLSLRKLGFVLPLYATDEGEILSGHQRHLGAEELGWGHVPVVRVPKRKNVFEKGLNLVFNRCTNDVTKEASTQEMWAALQRAIDIGAVTIPDTEHRYRCVSHATKAAVSDLVRLNDITGHRYARNMARTAQIRGVRMPIVIDSNLRLVNGAGRLWIAAEAKEEWIDAVLIDPEHAEFAGAMLNQLSMDFEVKEKYQDVLRANAFRRKIGTKPYLGHCFTFALLKGKPCHTFDINDKDHRAKWTRLYGTTVLDFGAGLMDESRMLIQAGIKSVPFEPYVCGDSDTPQLEDSRRVVLNFLSEIAQGYGFHTVFASAILNSVPFIEDRRHVLRIISSLCGPRTTFYTHCIGADSARVRTLHGNDGKDRSSEDSGTFMIDYEPNTSIGDIAEVPKVQKFHEPQELQDLLLEFFTSVQVERMAVGLSATCRGPRPVDLQSLTRAIEFEFDLPHAGDQRLGLVNVAKIAFSKRLGVTIS